MWKEERKISSKSKAEAIKRHLFLFRPEYEQNFFSLSSTVPGRKVFRGTACLFTQESGQVSSLFEVYLHGRCISTRGRKTETHAGIHRTSPALPRRATEQKQMHSAHELNAGVDCCRVCLSCWKTLTCICMGICEYLYPYTYIYIPAHIYIHAYVYVYLYMNIYHTYVYMYTYIYTHVCAHAYTYAHTYTYFDAHTCMYVSVRPHHTHESFHWLRYPSLYLLTRMYPSA